MSIEQPIFPAYGNGQLITTSAVATAVTNLLPNCKQIKVSAITQAQYVRVTDSASTASATTADLFIFAGQSCLLSKGELTRLSVISPGGAGQIHVISCDGSTSI